MCQTLYILLILLLIYLIIYNTITNKKYEKYIDYPNQCKLNHGLKTYNKCIIEGGDPNVCKNCYYCVCVAKSGNVQRCATDELFKDCMYNNKKLNNYKASKNCGFIKEGTPCKCMSCYSNNPIQSEELVCKSGKSSCNSSGTDYCYFKSKKNLANSKCDCEEGLLVNTFVKNTNKNCLCSPKKPRYEKKNNYAYLIDNKDKDKLVKDDDINIWPYVNNRHWKENGTSITKKCNVRPKVRCGCDL